MLPALRSPLAARGSLTARLVAAARGIGVAQQRDELAATALGGSLGDLVGRVVELDGPRGRVTRLGLGGLTDHAALRMLAVDDAVSTALAEARRDRTPIRQLVVVGAGYDTRAWRLGALHGVTVHELDLPGTQAGKAERLADVTPVAGRVAFHPVDLAATGLDAALRTTDVDAEAPALWLWEAVAMYLPAAAVTTTLTDIGAWSSPGSRLVMTHLFPPVVPLPSGRESALLDNVARFGFGALGEPLRSDWTPHQAAAELSAVGYELDAITRSTAWAADAGVSRHLATFQAERLVTAHRP